MMNQDNDHLPELCYHNMIYEPIYIIVIINKVIVFFVADIAWMNLCYMACVSICFLLNLVTFVVCKQCLVNFKPMAPL